jgi:hypothetical protein
MPVRFKISETRLSQINALPEHPPQSDVDGRIEDAAWRRINAADGVTTSTTTFAAELIGDFTTELG